ncbi:MAG: 2-phosphoglycerate kinase [Chloroflexi bacterium]|nr:2-phosphoglycerate kinase [Chloroflexota bacterium]
MPQTRVILIGGTSTVGKTTLAQAMAGRLGWSHISTDSLARHPGRPWKTEVKPVVPEQVADHYLSLSVDELITDVLRHYREMWLSIEELIAIHVADETTEGLILEGSALWPESVAKLELDGVTAFWLTASDELLESRIRSESRFAGGTPDEQELIEKFLARTLCYNNLMMRAVDKLGLVSIDVESVNPSEDLADKCLVLALR